MSAGGAIAGEARPAAGRRLTIGTIWQTFGPLLSLILLSLVLWLLEPVFMSGNNWLNIARQASLVAILGTGMTFVILTGGIDLSVGSIVALSSVIGGILMHDQGWSMWPAVLLMVLAGAACGLVNGLIVTLGDIPPFIVTLGTMQIFRGAALQLTDGKPIFDLTATHPRFDIWGTRELFGVPSPVIITGVVFLAAFLILRYTRLGLYTYAIGGNEQATRFSGVHIDRYKLAVYVLMGLAAGIAGVMWSSRLNSTQPTVADGEELNAIAAVVIGGTSLLGGTGGAIGSAIGALVLRTISFNFRIFDVDPLLQTLFEGLVLLAAVSLGGLRLLRLKNRLEVFR